MTKQTILEKLSAGVVERDLKKETEILRKKWQETGLLEGLDNDRAQSNMAVLLENQTKELLREASQMSAGDVEGFAAVAFPIVRRVFGGLVANDIVSVQPMSLPTGLIFFLDFTYNGTRLGSEANDSVFGGGRVASQITGGVILTGEPDEDGFYNLNNGYSSPTGSATVGFTIVASGSTGGGKPGIAADWTGTAAYTDLGDDLVRFDPDIASGTIVAVGTAPKTQFPNFNTDNYVGITPTLVGYGRVLRRLTREDPTDSTKVLFVVVATGSETSVNLSSSLGSTGLTTTYPEVDARQASNALGSIVGTTPWGLENDGNIPELDIKVDSVSISANTKKLKAKWTPELQQDIAAYQNLDAEVELTAILSEHIALEIDQELLEDLVKRASAGTFHWSRRPGVFLERSTGNRISSSANESLMGADFTGNVSEWYETLIETINDVSAQIHRKTLRGGANFIVVGPETAAILEFTTGFRATTSVDEDMGEVGAVKVGSLRKKWDVYVDPYFFRNVVLVGRKGSSFLESGYVFAPYVPLQVTPTIFHQESFVPRKAVYTRYAKKMVKPDHYGIVIIQNFLG